MTTLIAAISSDGIELSISVKFSPDTVRDLLSEVQLSSEDAKYQFLQRHLMGGILRLLGQAENELRCSSIEAIKFSRQLAEPELADRQA